MNYKIKKDDFFRINVFKILNENLLGRSDELTFKLKNVIILLDELEYLFEDDVSFDTKLNENIFNLQNQDINHYENDNKFIKKVVEIANDDTNTKSKLNKLFTVIDKYLEVEINLNIYKEITSITDTSNLVFLSYAYDDKAYTIGLFYFFLNKGVYLFIDWMHNPKIESGNLLKKLLSNTLRKSNQFLFLDTASSQLSMSGNYIIRQWCAWEVGYYFKPSINKSIHRKFYLSIYYENQLENRKSKNLLLEDFNPIVGIRSGVII